MAKKVVGKIKLQIEAGKANPSPPAPVLIKKALNISKGSAVPNKNKVAEITREQLEEIAKIKMNDLNATTMDAAVEMIKGSCRAMGVTVKEG